MNIFEIFQKQKSVSTDSRTLKKGDLYFALKGANFDGNQFADKAIQEGASVAIVDDESIYQNSPFKEKLILVEDVLISLQTLAKSYRKTLKIPVIGITGSNGKTTSKELCASVLSQKYKVSFTKGNLNNHIGVPLTILSTPANVQILIVEMGANHQGEIDQLCNIASPEYGIITNIGKAHLEGFGGIEGVKKGKSEMYRFLEASHGKIFCNGDDPILKDLLPVETKVIFYSPSDFPVCSKDEFLAFKVRNEEFKTKLIGDFNVANIALSLKLGEYFGVELNRAIDAVVAYSPSNNRSQLIEKEGVKIILDAYNSNPTSLLHSISSFIKNGDENKVLILGDMLELGSDSEEEHFNLLQQIKSVPFKKIILIGPIFSKMVLPEGNMEVFESTSDAKQNFSLSNYTGCTLLLKGSRGIGVENLIM